MKKYLKFILKLLITIGIFYVIFRKFNINISQLFRNIQWFPFIITGLAMRLLLIPTIAINRWKLFLHHSGVEESFFTLAKINFMSAFLGIILPSSQGNDVVRMYMIEKRHNMINNNKTSSSSVIIERMIGFMLLSLIGLISSIAIPYFPYKEKVIFLISIITISFVAVIFCLTNRWLYCYLSVRLSRLKVFKKSILFIEKTHFSLVSFPYKKVLIPSVLLILLLQFCTMIIVYLVFLSFGIKLPFYQHMSFYPIIAILSVLPIAISGLGLREGLFVYFYSLVGVSPELAVGVSLINYMVEVLSAACVGGVLYLFNFSKKSNRFSYPNDSSIKN